MVEVDILPLAVARVAVASPRIFGIGGLLVHHGRAGRAAMRAFIRFRGPARGDVVV